jgi:phage FluMu protein Com
MRKPEALIGIFVKQLNAALADENAALIAEIERLTALVNDCPVCSQLNKFAIAAKDTKPKKKHATRSEDWTDF